MKNLSNLEIVKTNSYLEGLHTVERINKDLLKAIIESDKLLQEKYDDSYDSEKHFLEALYNKLSDKTHSFTTKYNRSGMHGRVYPTNGLSLANVRRPLRHTLAKGQYIDIDIKNAQPTILEQICVKFKITCTFLTEYVNNRESILKLVINDYECTRDQAKNLFIVLIFLGTFNNWIKEHKITKKTTPNKFIKSFIEELKNISTIICNKNPKIFQECEHKKKKNAIASTFAIFLQHMECTVLESMFCYCVNNSIIEDECYPTIILCHDGLMIPNINKVDIKKTLLKIESYVKKETLFEIKLEIKEFTEAFEIDYEKPKLNNLVIFNPEYLMRFNTEYFETLNSYDIKKKYFEIFCCKVLKPTIYIHNEMSTATGFMTVSYKTTQNIIDEFLHLSSKFIKTWVKDPKIKLYSELVFIPQNPGFNLNENSSDYNLFLGYNPLIKTVVKNPNIIDTWKNIVFQLCEANQEYYDYYIKFLAQIIQFPNDKLGVSIIIRSVEGVGKGQHLKAIERILTRKYFYSESDKDNFIGKFATAFNNRLLVNWDETEGVHCEIDKIKSRITEEFMTTEQKGINKIESRNVARIIFTTNNKCPIPISDSNRRFVVFQATNYYKVGEGNVVIEFWKKYIKLIDEPEFIAALYNYLNTIDLTNWDFMDFPKTLTYNQMNELCKPAELLFIIEYICVILKDKKDHTIKGSELFELYNQFCMVNKLNHKYNVNIKDFYANLDNLKNMDIKGITFKNIGGIKKVYFSYNILYESLIYKKHIEQEIQFTDDN